MTAPAGNGKGTVPGQVWTFGATGISGPKETTMERRQSEEDRMALLFEAIKQLHKETDDKLCEFKAFGKELETDRRAFDKSLEEALSPQRRSSTQGSGDSKVPPVPHNTPTTTRRSTNN